MRALLQRGRLFIGVVHAPALPGAPGFSGDFEAGLAHARADAAALVEGGCDALVVENFGDTPFFADAVPAETIAALTRVVTTVNEVRGALPVGVNVLRNDVRAGLGICAATGASFVRANVHTGVMATDQGLIEGRAAETLRVRAALCPEVAILADVHVKHAVALAGESIADAAENAARRGRADALIVSGRATGSRPASADLIAVRERVPGTPLLIGSGLDADNAAELLALCDGAVVGTWLKERGDVTRRVDPRRVAELRTLFDRAE